MPVSSKTPIPSSSNEAPTISSTTIPSTSSEPSRKAVQIAGKKLPKEYLKETQNERLEVIIEDSDDSDFVPETKKPKVEETDVEKEKAEKRKKYNERRKFLRQWHKENPGQKFPRKKKTPKKKVEKKQIPKKKKDQEESDDEDMINNAMRIVALAAKHGHPEALRIYGNRTPYY